MKTKILTSILFLLSLSVFSQNENPYAIFGYEGKVLKTPQERKQYMLLIPNIDTTSAVAILGIETSKGKYYLFDKEHNILKEGDITQEQLARFISMDAKASKYPDISTYAFVANTPIRAVDPDGNDIYMLFVTTDNYRGDAMLLGATETRKRNIERSTFFNPATDKVVVLQIQDMADVKAKVENTVSVYSEKYGKTKEVGVFSHGGWQGPTGSKATSSDAVKNADGTNGKQMEPKGWGKVNFNWVEDGANFTMYGCNTGNDISKDRQKWVGSFAREISKLPNFENVQVSGQSSSAFPSFYPNIRETSLSRELPIGYWSGNTYMVGGNKSDGIAAEWFSPMKSPSANPMNSYKDGKKVGSGFQSTTNDNPINK